MKRKKLLLLPGWGMGEDMWKNFPQMFFEKYETCFGSWKNATSPDKYEQIINTVKCDYIIGFSLGAVAALHAATKRSFKAIALFGASPRFTRDSSSDYFCRWYPAALEKMKKDILKSPDESIAKFYRSAFHLDSENKIFREKTHNFSLKTTTEELIAGLDYLINTDLRKNLSDIKTPLLMISGKNDIITPPEASEYILKRCQNARLMNSQSHHGAIFTCTDFFASQIIQFFESQHD